MGDKSHDDEQMKFGRIPEIAMQRYYEHNGKAKRIKTTTTKSKNEMSEFLPMPTIPACRC